MFTLVLATAPAFAHEAHVGPDHHQIQDVRADVHASVDGYAASGLGGRIEFAVAPNGLLRGAKDELALSLGGDAFFAPSPFDPYGPTAHGYATPVAALQWNFYVSKKWSIFPEAGVAGRIGFDDYVWVTPFGVPVGTGYVTPDLGFGARYHFGDRTALLMRVSTPGGAQIGLNF